MAELELDLCVAADDVAKAQAALLAMAGRPRPTRRSFARTYYDTPDRALRRRDLVLGVRKEGRRFIQTVTAPALAGGEWEDAIAGASPDPAAPAAGRHLPSSLAADALKPLFTTVVQRAAFDLAPRSGTRIAVAIDRGEIRTADGGDAVPAHAIRLTLTRGEPVVLWDIAVRLLEIVPFRVETATLAERGYRLIEGEQAKPPVVHATPIRLEAKMAFDAALQTMGRSCIAMLLSNEWAAVAGDADGVHQMRVAVRRLRAVLSAVKPMLPEEHFRWANGELKWLGAALGPVRNWDVFTASLLAPVQQQALARGRDLTRLAAASERQRRAAYERARDGIQSQRFTAAVLRLARWFEARGWRDQPVSEESARLVAPLRKVAPDILARVHRKAQAGARKFAALTPPQRHRLRIVLKKLRYTIEFLESIYPPDAVRRLVRRIKPLQDDLGHANDVRSAHALVADLRNGETGTIERAGGIVLGWHDRGLAQSEPTTRRHAGRFRRGKPFW